MSWLEQFLKDKKRLRDIRTWISVAVALALGLAYIGFWGNAQTGNIDFGLVSGLTIISIISVSIIRNAFTERGEEEEFEENEQIKELDTKLNAVVFESDEDDLVYEFLDAYNDKHQKIADKQLTELKIRKLNNKLRKRRLKRIFRFGINKLEKKIERLKENQLFYRWYRPITYPDLMRLDIRGWNQIQVKDKSHIRSNKKQIRFWRSTAPRLFTGMVTSMASLPFIVDNWGVVIRYYSMLILIGGWSALKDYGWIRQHIKNEHPILMANQLELLNDAKKYVAAHKITTEITPSKIMSDVQDNKESTEKLIGSYQIALGGGNSNITTQQKGEV